MESPVGRATRVQDIYRPLIAQGRLVEVAGGKHGYLLKKPSSNGVVALVLEPLDFWAVGDSPGTRSSGGPTCPSGRRSDGLIFVDLLAERSAPHAVEMLPAQVDIPFSKQRAKTVVNHYARSAFDAPGR